MLALILSFFPMISIASPLSSQPVRAESLSQTNASNYSITYQEADKNIDVESLPDVTLPRINTDPSHLENAHAVEEKIEESHWVSLGECRITEYCPSCNSPAGSYCSSSGKRLEEGMVACSWLDNGTRIRIDDQEYVVMDYCGTEAIDIFCDTEDCLCDMNCYKEVFVYE